MYENIEKEKSLEDTKQVNSREQDKSTGIPVHMKNYIENRTGISYDDVRVHYNSSRPSQFKALAYAQGNNVFLQQGQETHLMHELYHVAQQKQGIVKPTSYIGNHAINDNVELEKEADLCEAQYKREASI